MINPYLTGNKVYRGGSNTATSGTVDPTGYVDRERRSQLAKQILQRSGQQTQKQNEARAAGRVMVPGLEYRNDIGNITPPTITPTTNPQDAQYMSESSQAYENWATQANALQQQRQQAILENTQKMTALQRGAERMPTNLQDLLAARGITQSTAGLNMMGEQAKSLQDQINEIQGGMSEVDRNYILQSKDFGERYARAMSGSDAQLASRLAAQAGNLGIGKPGDVEDPGSEMSNAIKDAIARANAGGTGGQGGITPPATPAAPAKPAAPAPPKPAAVSRPAAPSGTFRQGSSGSSVRAIQEMLNRAGAGIKVDGIYGKNTAAAVKKYQASHKLAADGVVGRNTLASLWR